MSLDMTILLLVESGFNIRFRGNDTGFITILYQFHNKIITIINNIK